MVQLSPSRTLETLAPSELSMEEDCQSSPKSASPRVLTALQLALSPSSPSSTYYGYDKYIEDGLICLKHKIRNIEKKKLKLERYIERLKTGEKLNEDQLEAVGKYDEVVHNLKFAKELQSNIGALTQDLLRAQRKAVRQEKQLKMDEEKKRLSLVLQVQYVLHSLQREDVRRSFCNTHLRPCYLSTQDVESLLDLATLLGSQRDHGMSLKNQMERAALVFWELLEGNDGPVAGSTNKLMKEKLLRLVNCGFFDHVPLPKVESQENPVSLSSEAPSRLDGLKTPLKLCSKEVPSKEFLNSRYLQEAEVAVCRQDEIPTPRAKKEDFLAMKEREPPDSWETEFADPPVFSQSPIQKPFKGAVGLMAKTVNVNNSLVEPKEKRQKKIKVEQDLKPVPVAVELFNSASPLPKDPVQRKQQLESLMDQISGCFSFMQESLLDGEASPISTRTKRGRQSPACSTPLAKRDLTKSPSGALSQRSTPLRILLSGENLPNGERSLNSSDLELHHEDKPHPPEDFSSPPLYRRGSSISVTLENQSTPKVGKLNLCNGVPSAIPAQAFSTPPSHRSLNAENHFNNLHSVFNVASLPISERSGMKAEESGFSESLHHRSFSAASTQTPPELNPPEEELQMEGLYEQECVVSSSGRTFPGAPLQSRLGQTCFPRGTIRGGYEPYKVTVRSPRGSFMPQLHREPASALYVPRENGFQQSFKRASGTAAQRSSAGWSDSSLVSSPDRDGTYPHDSGISDTLSIPPVEVPVTPHGTHNLMPVHMYPLTQLRVAFSAARTANFAPGTLDQPIVFDLLHTNLGEMFDTGTGRFTCPASGTYVFIFHILKLAISVPLYINLMRNEEVMVSAYANDGAPDHETASNHAVLQLFQGDQVWLRLHRGALYGSSWKYSTFSGFLLYPD
ncbi:hypothetical protein DNTS_028662 [Danionella cerebrum]|uniref:C1q domain-containing protein n=1 Tax=Danionella cerebrum TaxID=2873325 RepID=A0A553QRC5_9TELE|nr:hypothetical protein DNTS_028662 [Danionella translucida]TRY92310.1 hypothetical protein DNTS_028662 [Danionella translucida]